MTRRIVEGGMTDRQGASADHITADGKTLAIVVRAGPMTGGTQFVTPPEAGLQLGVLAHPDGTTIARHAHREVERRVTGTSEALIVRSGSCDVDVFDGEELVATRRLEAGDVMLLLAGGHGLRMLEDTVLIEVKQGPYLGLEEKVRY